MKNSFYTLLLVMLAVPVFGQGIKLSDLTKIDLFSSGPWWAGGGMKWVEVIPEGEAWNCYHLRSQERPKLTRDSTRRLIKAISIQSLNQLLSYINEPDTELKFRQFTIPTNKLKQYIDTLQSYATGNFKERHDKQDSLLINLTAEQKAYFLKMIESKQALSEAYSRAFHPVFDDDRSYYGIVFTHKDKHRDSIYAYVNSFHLYHLPWQIRNKQSYNLHLTELFESMLGNESYDKNEKGRLNYQIDNEIFRWKVVTKISWDNYKTNHQANYAQLNKTLTAFYMPSPWKGYLRSSLLPNNIQLRFSFLLGDTLKVKDYNSREKEMISNYKKGSFFFDYLKAHPTTTAVVQDVVPKTIQQVAITYPDIAKFDARQIKFICTTNFYQGWVAYKIS